MARGLCGTASVHRYLGQSHWFDPRNGGSLLWHGVGQTPSAVQSGAPPYAALLTFR